MMIKNRLFLINRGFIILLLAFGLSTLAFAEEKGQKSDKLIDMPVFNESLIFGTVFLDKNGNGIQDDDEVGIAGVSLVTMTGEVVVTDSYGRYSLIGAKTANITHGGRFVIKLDVSSLPHGFKVARHVTEIVRLTTSMPRQIDFPISKE